MASSRFRIFRTCWPAFPRRPTIVLPASGFGPLRARFLAGLFFVGFFVAIERSLPLWLSRRGSGSVESTECFAQRLVSRVRRERGTRSLLSRREQALHHTRIRGNRVEHRPDQRGGLVVG